MKKQDLAICLWYDDQAEEAVSFYTLIFEDSSIGHISRFGKEGFEHHGKSEGSVMTVEFMLNGMKFLALNGGPVFKFNEAISVVINCDTQEEIDHYWSELSEGGIEQPCGWLKDKFGVSWQIVPKILTEYLMDSDNAKKKRVEEIAFQMMKFDIQKIKDAYLGK